MATRRVSVCAALWLVSAMVYAQSGMAGSWTGEEQSPRGAVPVVLQLTVNGSGATGTVTVGENPAVAIAEGTVSGRTLTFKTTTVLNGTEVPVSWEGEAKDDQLTLVRTVGAGGRTLAPIVLQRSE